MVRNYDTSTTAGKIKVMQSASAGTRLQRRSLLGGVGDWHDIAVSDDWDWLNNDYRIRPEPREWCLRVDVLSGLPTWTPWTAACEGQGIHVREVIA